MTGSQIKTYRTKRKKWLYENQPYCIFCGKFVKFGDLAHKIRVSECKAYECLDKNNGLAHRECHFIFDNQPQKAKELPLFCEVMQDIREIDEKIYNKILLNLSK